MTGWHRVCGVQWEDVEYHVCTVTETHEIHICGDEFCAAIVHEKYVRREKFIRIPRGKRLTSISKANPKNGRLRT